MCEVSKIQMFYQLTFIVFIVCGVFVTLAHNVSSSKNLFEFD